MEQEGPEQLEVAPVPDRTAVLEEVFRTAPSFLHVLRGPEFIFEFANEAYYRLVGQRDLIGRPAFEALPEAARAGYEELISGVMTSREPFYGRELRVMLARTPGSPPEERIIDLVYQPLLDPDGSCSRVLGHGTDVTELVLARNRTEAALRESEIRGAAAAVRESEARQSEAAIRDSQARLSAALALAQLGTFEWNVQTGQVTLDDRSREIFGFGPHEGFREQEIFARIDPDDFEHVHTAAVASQRSLQRLEIEYRICRSDGEYRTLVSISDAIAGPEGEAARIVGVFGDVTERRQAEAALRDAVARYEQQVRLFDGVASTTPDFVYLFDLHGRFQYANRRLLEVWGMELPEIVGKTCLELGYAQWHHDMHMREIAQVIATREPIKGEVPFQAPRTGIFGVYEYIFTPVFGPGGEVELIAGTTRDITAHKQAADVLRESARRKDEFLATLAHELRNPLAPIVTATELLRLRSDDHATVTRARDTIRRQVDHMRHLIDDLLDVARITRGMVSLQRARVDLDGVLTSAIQMARPLIDRRRQDLQVSVLPEAVTLEGDDHRLTQIVANLLTNAAKFTPEGGRIRIVVETSGNEMTLHVCDNGKGIPPEMLPQIFDLFIQVNPSIDRAEGGLGLGLTLVRKLVEMHDGHVEARSEGVGQGSEFIVRLPLQISAMLPTAAERSARDTANRKHLEILAVDDNVDAADTLAELLRLWGHQVRVAYSGPEALVLAKQHRPDVILLDIGLPGMDGYRVAQELRHDPDTSATRVVATTGFGQESDRDRALAAGFDAYLTKPVAPDRLRHALVSD